MSSQLQDALGMFAFLAIELSVLFIGISLLVGVLQRHIPPSKVEALLTSSGKRGYFLAAGLGAITPFCSCSTIPMLKGLIRARAGFGPMMVFLFSSPLLNPIVVGLLVATFGWTLTAIYVLAALVVAVGAGWLLHAWLRALCAPDGDTRAVDVVHQQARAVLHRPHRVAAPTAATPLRRRLLAGLIGRQQSLRLANAVTVNPLSRLRKKYSGVWREAWSDFIDVLPYLLIGIAIGSVIYGFMPTDLLEQYAGPDNPFAIPVAAVIGLPLYIRAEAVIPLAAALMAKGVGAGTVLAFIIGSAGASLTELILLRSLFTLKLLAAF